MSEFASKTYPGQGGYFYCFSKVVENTGEIDEDFLQYTLEDFTDNYNAWKLYNWEQYWTVEGVILINESYLRNPLNQIDFNYSENIIQVNQLVNESAEKVETETIAPNGDKCNNSVQNHESWFLDEQLIHDHFFSEYTKLYYDYFCNFKTSLEYAIDSLRDEHTELDEDNILEAQQIAKEFQQLKLLGLPTTFCKHRRAKYQRKFQSNYYFPYSNTDMEDDELNEDTQAIAFNSETGMEFDVDCDVDFDANADDDDDNDNNDKLKGIQNKTIDKSTKNLKKKRNRKLRGIPEFMLEEKHMIKYWRKRFSLFSRFDEGIRLDRESWYSVTPEKVAAHLARRVNGFDIVVDGCCGCGGNTIQFALTSHKVIAVDNDPIKLEMAKHNATIYGVADKIEFILGDFIEFLQSTHLQADAVFVSPPWGGPSYNKNKCYDIEKYLQPVSATILMESIRKITDNIILFLPRRSNVQQIVKLAGVGNSCEIVYNYLDSSLVALSALYGKRIVKSENNRFIENN